jgi:hypothetical protein
MKEYIIIHLRDDFSKSKSVVPTGREVSEFNQFAKNKLITGQLPLIIKVVLHSSDTGTKWEYTETVHQLFVDFKKAYESVRREVLYNILIEFGIPLNLVRLIKMCLNETYSNVRIGKHLSDNFPIQNGLKQGDALSPLLVNFALEYAIRKVRD